ncbi:hypothetical protein AB1Y20_018169 [Prymnesium parvum]|uniref:Uncharacterized protein n=1 Tax=Prymnesium parvum TaxID=97485 RepID=A0AB34JQR0_PRYPA
MEVCVRSSVPTSPRAALKVIAGFLEASKGVLHSDMVAQLQLVSQSIADTYLPACLLESDHEARPAAEEGEELTKRPKKQKAAKQERLGRTDAGDKKLERKRLKKLAKKALKKLPGGAGTCDEVCAAAQRFEPASDGAQMADGMAAALKALVKQETIKKTGEKRGGQPVYALSS